MAVKHADSEENVAAAFSVVKWTSWHTRVATGWTQSADSKGEENEVGDRDDLDRLSQELLLAIKLNVSEKGEPVGAQTEANDQATAWAEQWGLNWRSRKKSIGRKTWGRTFPTHGTCHSERCSDIPGGHRSGMGRDPPAGNLPTE